MNKEIYTIGDKEVCLLTPDKEYDTLFYANSFDFESYEEVYSRFPSPSFGLAVIKITDWFGDLTPWAEPTVFEAGPDFGGNADKHLNYIVNEVIPFIEEKAGVPDYRGIVGFSLGGLFSVYAFYKTNKFFLCGCPSGSMWYDGFLDWMKERKPGIKEGSIYFSVGDIEQNTTYERMQVTGKRMREACDMLCDMDYDASFRYTKGDHMDDVTGKIEGALRWLTGE